MNGDQSLGHRRDTCPQADRLRGIETALSRLERTVDGVESGMKNQLDRCRTEMKREVNGTGTSIDALREKIDDHQQTLGSFAIRTTTAIGEVKTEMATTRGAIVEEVNSKLSELRSGQAFMTGKIVGIFAVITVLISLLGIAASILTR